MSTGQTREGPYTYTAGEALEEGRFVKLSGSTSRTVIYADAGEDAVGVTLHAAASGAKVSVAGWGGDKTMRVIAAGNYAVNATVYVANDGKVSTSISGRPIGFLLDDAAGDGQPVEMLPYPVFSGNVIGASVSHDEDFLSASDVAESGSPGFWTLDANNGGALSLTDAHGGVISLTPSDTTAADNDEIYLVSTAEIYKPAAGKSATFRARLKLTEANVGDASILFGLKGGDTADVENAIADGGATLEDAGTWIAMHKSDGGAVFKGTVRDDALDTDTDVGAFSSGEWHELMITVVAAAGAKDATVTFFVDGVAGGTKPFTLSSAGEMRLILGVKNGGANAETLLVDRVDFSFDR